MSVLRSNLERVKNVLAGNYTAKSKVSVGYTKESKRRKEGDIWQENGRTWTIKNGIKQNITKLDAARKEIIVPFACPVCKRKLDHEIHTFAWKMEKKCFDCVTVDEGRMRMDGTFEEYSKERYRKNALAWLEEKRVQFNDFINNPESLRIYVTEKGHVEDWYGGLDTEKIKEQFEKEYNEFKDKIDNL